MGVRIKLNNRWFGVENLHGSVEGDANRNAAVLGLGVMATIGALDLMFNEGRITREVGTSVADVALGFINGLNPAGA